MSKDIHLLHCRSSSKLIKLCNCLLSKYGSRNLTEKELNHDACQLQLVIIISIIIVLLLFCTFLSKMSSSFLNVLQKIICVTLMIKFLFLL